MRTMVDSSIFCRFVARGIGLESLAVSCAAYARVILDLFEELDVLGVVNSSVALRLVGVAGIVISIPTQRDR